MIYIVKDLNGNVRGVYSSLQAASATFKDAYEEGLQMLESAGCEIDDIEDPFYDCDNQPDIEVWEVDGNHVTVYYHPEEIQEALASGEKYD